MCERERESVCVSVCVCVCVRDRENCVCVRERERERVCVCFVDFAFDVGCRWGGCGWEVFLSENYSHDSQAVVILQRQDGRLDLCSF